MRVLNFLKFRMSNSSSKIIADVLVIKYILDLKKNQMNALAYLDHVETEVEKYYEDF